jgi:hypothetical protein
MQIRFTKHITVNGNQYMSGTMLPLSVLDKLLEDGRVVYHHPDRNTYEIIKAELFVVVYDSNNEMELANILDKKRIEVLKEQKRYK